MNVLHLRFYIIYLKLYKIKFSKKQSLSKIQTQIHSRIVFLFGEHFSALCKILINYNSFLSKLLIQRHIKNKNTLIDF